MAAPTYDTDLVEIVSCDTETGFSLGEFTNMTAGRTQALEGDYFIQGIKCFSTLTPALGIASCAVSGFTSFALSAGQVVFGWMVYFAPNSMDTFAAGGQRIVLGTALSAWKAWKAGGNNYPPGLYGGWKNVAVDPTWNSSTPDYSDGAPSGNWTHVGIGVSLPTTFPSRGAPLGMDVFRRGYGYLGAQAGESGNYATFAGMAAANDDQNMRWGILQDQGGGVYLFKGRLGIGYDASTATATACNFVDANRTILIDDTPRVLSTFNRIEINHASSVVDWTNISFIALGTVSKGDFEMMADAAFTMTGGGFADLGTFIFDSNSTLTGVAFRECGAITQNSATMTACVIEGSTVGDGAAALVSDNVSSITGCEFTFSDGHAIELTAAHAASPAEHTLDGCAFAGYGADDSTDAAIYNNSGKALIIVLANCSQPTVRNGTSASTSFKTSITLTCAVTNESGQPIQNALVYIDNDDESPYILNTLTDEYGEASVLYTAGPVADSRWRVRLYGYKPFKQLVDIESSDITLPVTLVVDPQQT